MVSSNLLPLGVLRRTINNRKIVVLVLNQDSVDNVWVRAAQLKNMLTKEYWVFTYSEDCEQETPDGLLVTFDDSLQGWSSDDFLDAEKKYAEKANLLNNKRNHFVMGDKIKQVNQ